METQYIEELTAEQKAACPLYVEKWISIGLSTTPTDLEKSKHWITVIHQERNKPVPQYWLFIHSPVRAVHAAFMVNALGDFNDDYQDTELYSDTQTWKFVFDNVYEQLSKQFTDLTWNDQTKARMLSFLSKAYLDKSSFPQYYDHFCFGAQEAASLSFYDYFIEECDLHVAKPMSPYIELAKHCGWWAPYENLVIIQDKPSRIERNERGVLHNENGPAIEYRDGWKLYFLEGYDFPEYVVMDPHLITVEDIDKESNAEKRRILLERFGYERYFEQSECTLVDHDEVQVAVNDTRKMPRMLIATKHGDMYLVGTDGSTRRTYFMNIRSDDERVKTRFGEITTCKQAHELISGLDESKCLAQS